MLCVRLWNLTDISLVRPTLPQRDFMITGLTQILEDAWIKWPENPSPFDILSIKFPKADIFLNFSLPDSYILQRLDVRLVRCKRQPHSHKSHLKISDVDVHEQHVASQWQTPLKAAVSGVRAFIRRECRRVDVAVSLAPCSPSSISAPLWHISLPTRSFRFAWQME